MANKKMTPKTRVAKSKGPAIDPLTLTQEEIRQVLEAHGMHKKPWLLTQPERLADIHAYLLRWIRRHLERLDPLYEGDRLRAVEAILWGEYIPHMNTPRFQRR